LIEQGGKQPPFELALTEERTAQIHIVQQTALELTVDRLNDLQVLQCLRIQDHMLQTTADFALWVKERN